jgi:hypothetical protein
VAKKMKLGTHQLAEIIEPFHYDHGKEWVLDHIVADLSKLDDFTLGALSDAFEGGTWPLTEQQLREMKERHDAREHAKGTTNNDDNEEEEET